MSHWGRKLPLRRLEWVESCRCAWAALGRKLPLGVCVNERPVAGSAEKSSNDGDWRLVDWRELAVSRPSASGSFRLKAAISG